MPRKAAGLTAVKVRAAKPGRYGDGGGLYLFVRSPEARFWVFRYKLPGAKLREMGLGPASADGARGGVTLAEARAKAADLRRMVTAGIDPLRRREAAEEAAARAQAAAARAKTFQEVADLYLAAHEAGWRNAKHRAQWAMTLREYAGPHLGALPVATVETAHVVATLRPLWHGKPETAARLRGRIEAVLDFAAVHGWREGANPARWRGHLDKLFPKRGKVRPVRHHPALPWQDIGAFMATLHRHKGISARALEFLILTATRTGEVLGARWGEVDLDAGVWTVPGERMKGGKEHRVALVPAAVALLRGLLPERAAPDRLVFPGRREGRPLSVMALEMVMRRMNAHPEGEPPRWRDHRGDAAVPHGFRSTFRDWAGETTAHPREVVEAALSHRLGDKVEQAYARGDLFAKRRRLMEEWAAFCAKPPAEVVALRPAASDPDADSAKSADREAAGREPDAPPVLPLDVLHHHDVADGLLTGRTICSGCWIPRRHRDTLGDLG